MKGENCWSGALQWVSLRVTCAFRAWSTLAKNKTAWQGTQRMGLWKSKGGFLKSWKGFRDKDKKWVESTGLNTGKKGWLWGSRTSRNRGKWCRGRAASQGKQWGNRVEHCSKLGPMGMRKGTYMGNRGWTRVNRGDINWNNQWNLRK